LFDVEIAFLVPWALNLSQLNAAGYLSMLIFFGLLIIGFIYEWLNGSLDWTNKKLI
jgi:NADH-quinone oxidoreductase subunit A